MNTYQVTWYPPNAANAVSATVTAQDFVINEDMVVFLDVSNSTVFAIVKSLNPVVDRTASA